MSSCCRLKTVHFCPPGLQAPRSCRRVLAAGPKGPESVDVAAFAALVEGGRGRLSAPARATFWRNESFRSRGGCLGLVGRARGWACRGVLAAQAVAVALEGEDLGVVDEAVDHGHCGDLIAEDLTPG